MDISRMIDPWGSESQKSEENLSPFPGSPKPQAILEDRLLMGAKNTTQHSLAPIFTRRGQTNEVSEDLRSYNTREGDSSGQKRQRLAGMHDELEVRNAGTQSLKAGMSSVSIIYPPEPNLLEIDAQRYQRMPDWAQIDNQIPRRNVRRNPLPSFHVEQMQKRRQSMLDLTKDNVRHQDAQPREDFSAMTPLSPSTVLGKRRAVSPPLIIGRRNRPIATHPPQE